MVRITVFFVAGILTAIHGGWPLRTVEIPLCVALALAFVAGVVAKSNIVTGVAGLANVFLLGHMLVSSRDAQPDPALAAKVSMYKGVITRFAEEKARTFRTEITLRSIRTDVGWQQCDETILLYLPKDGRIIEYGDVILVGSSPSIIPPPANPGEFDFKRFMAFKGIYYQDFLRNDSVVFLGKDPPNTFLYHAILVRQWADKKIKSVVNGEREKATATALVLGVTDGLDSELLQSYASTGALHVLAVSGLHVSIIYWIILLVLKPLNRTRPLKWLLAFISVFILWSYAFVTGWSPSVLRAVMMFTFIAFSRPWRQSTNVYNTLASSMFCLLLYDPFFIMSVGFQLSYLAVFGIVFLQPRLYSIWEPRNRLVDETWKLSSVSIAAQIATLPIGLYYFHQFPNYFLPANLVVIPVSFVVLVSGLGVSAFAFFQPLMDLLGWVLTWSVRLMNYLVVMFGDLPYSVINGIYMDQWQAILLAILIVTVVLLFIQKSFFWLTTSLVATLCFSALQWRHFVLDVNSDVVRIYSVPGQMIVDRIRNGESYVIADSSVLDDWAKVSRYVEPSWVRAGVSLNSGRAFERTLLGKGWSAWMWHGASFIRVTDRDHLLPICAATFLIISNNSVASLASLEKVKCEKIIVDSSNSLYFAERLRNEARELGIALWSVPHEGAFEYRHANR
jgi:competence protein ComEC